VYRQKIVYHKAAFCRYSNYTHYVEVSYST